ncbi:MAG: GIY-YIG nuclease family protein [Thiobacillus sp.]|nr:GIY-YIG nuclease family protein [Thiobacillus sp.]MDP2057591.1 GIY-YIG nuclease family protein [Thiobacillus sp.]
MATVAASAAAWCVYMLRCADGSLYTGITTDIARRVAEHNGNSALGARYTRSRRPVQLVYVEAAANRAEATRREATIKLLDRARKLALCAATP